jgi:hypothetical protein
MGDMEKKTGKKEIPTYKWVPLSEVHLNILSNSARPRGLK